MFSVAWLYCLQNSMVWTPCGPRAVPTGGAGVAEPASSWILTMASTFFLGGIWVSPYLRSRGWAPPSGDEDAGWVLELRHLAELELDRGLPAEDVDQHLELELVLVDFGDLAGEVGERTFLDPHRLVDLVLEPGTAALGRRFGALDLDLEDVLDLAPAQWRGLGVRSHEPGDTRRVADGAPGVVVHV